MPGGLPGVQRQYQSPLWNLRSLRLLPHVGRLLQRDMHHREFGCEQLRRLRKHLPRIDTVLRSGRLYLECVCLGSDIVRRCLRRH